MKKLSTISEIIEALGGPGEVAAWADVTCSAVCNWVERDVIPPAWHLRLFMETKKRGLVIEPAALGFEEPVASEVRSVFYTDGAAA